MFVNTETQGRVTRRGLRIVLAGGALLLAGGAVAVIHEATATAGPVQARETVAAPAAPAMVLVFVSGAVVHPGLYRLSADARVADAVAAAGGITSLADPGHLPNMSALVHDGRQINVPLAKGTSTVAKLDINTASIDELADVPGMPAGLPDEILKFREQWGEFTTLTQLHDDLGVDTATVAGLRLYLRVQPTSSP